MTSPELLVLLVGLGLAALAAFAFTGCTGEIGTRGRGTLGLTVRFIETGAGEPLTLTVTASRDGIERRSATLEPVRRGLEFWEAATELSLTAGEWQVEAEVTDRSGARILATGEPCRATVDADGSATALDIGQPVGVRALACMAFDTSATNVTVEFFSFHDGDTTMPDPAARIDLFRGEPPVFVASLAFGRSTDLGPASPHPDTSFQWAAPPPFLLSGGSYVAELRFRPAGLAAVVHRCPMLVSGSRLTVTFLEQGATSLLSCRHTAA